MTLGSSLLWPRGCLDSAEPLPLLTLQMKDSTALAACMGHSRTKTPSHSGYEPEKPLGQASQAQWLHGDSGRGQRGKLLDHSPAPHFHLLTDMTGVAPALLVLIVPNTLYAQRSFFSW